MLAVLAKSKPPYKPFINLGYRRLNLTLMSELWASTFAWFRFLIDFKYRHATMKQVRSKLTVKLS